MAPDMAHGVMNTFAVRRSLRVKIGLLITGLVALSVLLLGGVLLYGEQRALSREMTKRGLAIAQNLSASARNAVLTRDEPTLNLLLADAMRQADVEYLVVTDRGGRVLAHTDVTRIGLPYARPKGLTAARDQTSIQTYTAPSGTRVVDFAVPLTFRATAIGALYLGFSQRSIEAAIAEARLQTIGISLVIALVGVAGASLLAAGMARPIRRLVAATQDVTEGRFDVSLAVRSEDEIGLLTHSFNRMTQSLREKELIKRAFGRYVARQVAEQLLRDPEHLVLSGSRREVTVVFCDIRGFTAMAERLTPEEVVQLVNDFYNLMIDATFHHEGTLDKFLGDAVMAVFGAPVQHGDHSLRAVRTALAMRAAVDQLSRRRIAAGNEAVAVGIGVSTGEAVAGTVGTEDRMEYTVIGDSVNLAARLESRAKPMQILVNERTYRAVSTAVEARPLGRYRFKGKGEEVEVYEVLSLR